jgi:hypothetical protein
MAQRQAGPPARVQSAAIRRSPVSRRRCTRLASSPRGIASRAVHGNRLTRDSNPAPLPRSAMRLVRGPIPATRCSLSVTLQRTSPRRRLGRPWTTAGRPGPGRYRPGRTPRSTAPRLRQGRGGPGGPGPAPASTELTTPRKQATGLPPTGRAPPDRCRGGSLLAGRGPAGRRRSPATPLIGLSPVPQAGRQGRERPPQPRERPQQPRTPRYARTHRVPLEQRGAPLVVTAARIPARRRCSGPAGSALPTSK